MSEHREDALQVEVPVERVDIDEAPYADDAGNMIVDVRASTSLSAFQSGWDTPGDEKTTPGPAMPAPESSSRVFWSGCQSANSGSDGGVVQ